MLDREQLETFATIVDERSFERAACVLNVSKGAVSQRIRSLEESLANVLLVRDKPVVPTSAGEVLLRHVKAIRLLEADALGRLAPGTEGRSRVHVAIAVNADSLATWVPSVLWPLLRRHRLSLEVLTDDQDHTVQRLARGEVIGCVSTEPCPSSGFVAERLGAMEYRCYATQEFADQYFANGLDAGSVLRAPALLFNRKDSLHDSFVEGVIGFRIERYTRHFLPAPIALVEAIAAGVGYGLVPPVLMRSRAGLDTLVELAPNRPVLVDLYWHHWEVEPPLSQEITRLVVEAGRHALATAQASNGNRALHQAR